MKSNANSKSKHASMSKSQGGDHTYHDRVIIVLMLVTLAIRLTYVKVHTWERGIGYGVEGTGFGVRGMEYRV